MRPMWQDFPDEVRFRSVASQFMFGDSLLVAPKVTKPYGVLKHTHLQEVTYALPVSSTWFNFYNKQAVESTLEDEWVTVTLSDLEQAVFVRGGSILPILKHDDCLAILACINNDIRLEVYPDSGDEDSGMGLLYLDDGRSFDYSIDADKNSAQMVFSYVGNRLLATLNVGTGYTDIPNVSEAVFYGMADAPKSVTDGVGKALTTVYESSTKTLYVQLSEDTKANDVDILITV